MLTDDNNNEYFQYCAAIETDLGVSKLKISQAVQHLQDLQQNAHALLVVPALGKIKLPVAKPTSAVDIVAAYQQLLMALQRFKHHQSRMFEPLVKFQTIKDDLIATKKAKDVLAYLAVYDRLKAYRLSRVFVEFCQCLDHIKVAQEKYYELIVQSKLFLLDAYDKQYKKYVARSAAKGHSNTSAIKKMSVTLQRKVDEKISHYRIPIQNIKNNGLILSGKEAFNAFNLESARLFSCLCSETFSFDVLNEVVQARIHQNDVFQHVKNNALALADGVFERQLVFSQKAVDQLYKHRQQIIFLYVLTKAYLLYHEKILCQFTDIKHRYESLRQSLLVPLHKLRSELNDLKIEIEDCETQSKEYSDYFSGQFNKLINDIQYSKQSGASLVVELAKNLHKNLLTIKNSSYELYIDINNWRTAIMAARRPLMYLYASFKSMHIESFLDAIKIEILKFRLIEAQLQQGWLADDLDGRRQMYALSLKIYALQATLKNRKLNFLIKKCDDFIKSEHNAALLWFRSYLVKMVADIQIMRLIFNPSDQEGNQFWVDVQHPVKSMVFHDDSERDNALLSLRLHLLQSEWNLSSYQALKNFEQAEQVYLQVRLNELDHQLQNIFLTENLQDIISQDISSANSLDLKIMRLDRWLILMLMAQQQSRQALARVIYLAILGISADFNQFMLMLIRMIPPQLWRVVDDLCVRHTLVSSELANTVGMVSADPIGLPLDRTSLVFKKQDLLSHQKIRDCRDMGKNPLTQVVFQAQSRLIKNKDLYRWLITEKKSINIEAGVEDYQRLNQSLLMPSSKNHFKNMLAKVIVSKVSNDAGLTAIYYRSKQSYFRDLLDNSVLRSFVQHTIIKSNSYVWMRFFFRGSYGTQSKIQHINQAVDRSSTNLDSYSVLLKGVGIHLSKHQLALVWQHHEKLVDLKQEVAIVHSAGQPVLPQHEAPCRPESGFLRGIGQLFSYLFNYKKYMQQQYQPLLGHE